jgi:acetyltransferase-like isoleucine patch superfamily enzyme
MVRYNGVLAIDRYTNINEYSEIRCDENIKIGKYTQISYNVNIWDTNTHCIFPSHKRRLLAEKHFPLLGYDGEKPVTIPVLIGDDCWIGKDSSIMKGCHIGNECIIGFHTILINKQIPEGKTVTNSIDLKIM